MSFFLFWRDACNGPLNDLDDLFISQSLQYKYPLVTSGDDGVVFAFLTCIG